jgi:hypothetical protein
MSNSHQIPLGKIDDFPVRSSPVIPSILRGGKLTILREARAIVIYKYGEFIYGIAIAYLIW